MTTNPHTHAPALWGDTVDAPADVAARLAPIAACYDDPDAPPAMVAYAMTRDLLDDYACRDSDPDSLSCDEQAWGATAFGVGIDAAFTRDEAAHPPRGDADDAWRAVIWDAVAAQIWARWPNAPAYG